MECIYRAFSVVETIESVYAKQTSSTAQPLSPQQLISCDSNADGCSGGDIVRAMDWLVDVCLYDVSYIYVSPFHLTVSDSNSHRA